MDFIERIFGISPDQGDGTLELALFAVLAIVALAAVIRQRRYQKF
jgi:MYXO-CTERM domain-containing protein